MRNAYQFRLLDELKPSDTQVRVSNVIRRKDQNGGSKIVDFSNETVVLCSEDGVLLEITFASATNGILTFHKRGIDENENISEHNKRTRGRGTKAYITARSSDFVDKDEEQTWNEKQIFNKDIEVKENGIFNKNITADGTVEAKKGFKVPTFNTLDEANAFFSEKFSGLQINVDGITYIYNENTTSWESVGISDPTPKATKTIAGTVRVATDEEVESGTEQGDNEEFLVITPKQFKDNSQVSYLSAKRELGEDIDCSGGPKGYFLGSGTEIVNVANDQNIDVGKNNTNKFLKLKNNGYINKLSFTVDTVGNPNEQLLLEPCDIVEDTTIYTKYSSYPDEEHSIVSFSGKKMQYINIQYKTPADSYGIIKIKDGSTVLKQQRVEANTTTIIEHDLGGIKTNINISIYFPSNGSSRIHTLSNIRWVEQKNGIQHIITEGTNIIPQIYAKGALLKTIGTSTNHYYTFHQSNDGYLSGEYTLGYESGKKYISNPKFPSSSRVDGTEVVGGSIGETTTGIEGGIYELPEGVELTGDLYIQEDGSIGNTETSLLFGVGLGNIVKFGKIKQGGIAEPINIVNNTEYTADIDGVVMVYAEGSGNTYSRIEGYIDGNIVIQSGSGNNRSNITFPVKRGQSYKYNITQGIVKNAKFYPINFTK